MYTFTYVHVDSIRFMFYCIRLLIRVKLTWQNTLCTRTFSNITQVSDYLFWVIDLNRFFSTFDLSFFASSVIKNVCSGYCVENRDYRVDITSNDWQCSQHLSILKSKSIQIIVHRKHDYNRRMYMSPDNMVKTNRRSNPCKIESIRKNIIKFNFFYQKVDYLKDPFKPPITYVYTRGFIRFFLPNFLRVGFVGLVRVFNVPRVAVETFSGKDRSSSSDRLSVPIFFFEHQNAVSDISPIKNYFPIHLSRPPGFSTQ